MKKGMILLLLFCVCINGCAGQQKDIFWEQVVRETGAAETETVSAVRETQDLNAKETDTETHEAEIYVDVTGAVQHPGVVKVPYGARVYEAIGQAGGLREDAAAELINQAAVLTDGQQIRVYTQEEAEEAALPAPDGGQEGNAGGGENAQGKININEAAAEELMTLPGIGEAKAADIIRYREENGGFGTIEEIMEIRGIKEAVFDKIKDKIAVTQ